MYKCKGKNERIATDIALEIHLMKKIRIICLMSLVQPRSDTDETEAGVDAKAARCTSMSGLFYDHCKCLFSTWRSTQYELVSFLLLRELVPHKQVIVSEQKKKNTRKEQTGFIDSL